MLCPDIGLPRFSSGPLVPVVAYLLVIVVLSGLVIISPGASPPPVLGMLWGVFLVALTVGALRIETVSPRSLLPPVRTLIPVIGVVIAFWGLYNLVAVALAVGGISGFDASLSRTAAHPLLYLAALFSSLLFTAIPEELLFRTYLQEKFTRLAGGTTRRAVLAGIGLVAVLFALFHLPRWFLASGHGVGSMLAARLLGLTLMGLAYGSVYALTGNLWLVALFHASMNQPPVVVSVHIPTELHLVASVIEYAAIVSLVSLTFRVVEPARTPLIWSRRNNPASTGD
ncbi:protease (plasmid) [Haloarcula sp. CBA1115]|uniref:CPBP family glutamic-type intramembrane protease n=1 Tax=unclassified Haloarcula TaxID=2624677 RepID=UPI000595596C|nr:MULTISPECIES: CPBP family glutamic-type intramembrane protease [unclassified Haloarcula]AJF27772.1 protease [Haloarcula sp. CBA1115]KAA9404266.1 CPBP family intramembrane metalloprotease [Haloarcula sp. CBA1131]